MMRTTRTNAVASWGLAALVAMSSLGGSSCKKAMPKETLLVAGASVERPYLEPLAKAFMAENPNVTVTLEGGGTTAGLVALKHGAIDVAAAARSVMSSEDDNYLRDYLVARDGVAIVVNPKNPVEAITRAELAAILLGTVTSWKEIKGSTGTAAIAVIGREARSNVRGSLQDLVLSGEETAAPAKVVGSAAEMLAAVRADENAIGYLTLRRLEPGVKALRIDRVEMSRATMLSGRYPLSRSFYLALHLNASPLAERFIDFALDKKGQALFADAGLLEVY